MKLVKRDVCLWNGRKSSEVEVGFVRLCQEKKELKLSVNGVPMCFVPMIGANGIKPTTGLAHWKTLPYGTEVEVEVM